MILYFTGTGNTEFIAKEIASRLDDDCLNLLTRIREKDYSAIRSDKPWVICVPVYVCEMPRFFAEFLRNVRLDGSREAYFIFSSGGYSGISGSLAKGIMRRKGITVKGYTDLSLPRNYPVSKLYKLLSDEEARARLAKAYGLLDGIASSIRNGDKLNHRYVFLFEKAITLPFNPVWCRLKFKADDFKVNGNCVGCGLCERVCPLVNITLADKKPVWGNNCTHCMACVSSCPKDAVEYGDVTSQKGKYHIKYHKEYLDGLRKM